MSRYELRLFMRNACGPAILGEVSTIDALDEVAAMAEARDRIRQLPRNCFGALYDPAGLQIWADDSPDPKTR